MNPSSDSTDDLIMNRREAIKRTALILGMAVSPSLLTGIMSAQPATGKAPTKPAYLDAKQIAIASAVAERIIPKTDTPGARDVGVPAFIDLMYGKFMNEEEKVTIARGLADVEATSVRTNQRSFAALTPAQQDGLLRTIAQASQDKEKTFFHLMKELTLLGYFSSEEVGKKVLHYDPIPGRYEGCIPISEVGNVAWTTMK